VPSTPAQATRRAFRSWRLFYERHSPWPESARARGGRPVTARRGPDPDRRRAQRPTAAEGDAVEYLLMTESLARHGTPEARAGDVPTVARQDARLSLGLSYAVADVGYYGRSRQ